MRIKNILFDLGNVLLPIDVKKTEQVLHQLGFQQSLDLVHPSEGMDVVHAYEVNQISSAQYIQAIQKRCRPHTSEQQIADAWNALILDFHPRTFPLLRRLKPHFNLYVLSNTNDLHQHYFEQLALRQTESHETLHSFFDKIFYSHKIEKRKPTPAAFQYVLQDAQIQASETLFIDDVLENIQAAQGLGFRTIHLQHPNDLEKELEMQIGVI